MIDILGLACVFSVNSLNLDYYDNHEPCHLPGCMHRDIIFTVSQYLQLFSLEQDKICLASFYRESGREGTHYTSIGFVTFRHNGSLAYMLARLAQIFRLTKCCPLIRCPRYEPTDTLSVIKFSNFAFGT